jgi:hypothetical protein
LGISQPGQFQGSFGLVVGKSTRPSIFSRASGLRASSVPHTNHLVPVFSCEEALNIKKIKIKIKIKIEGLGLGWHACISSIIYIKILLDCDWLISVQIFNPKLLSSI